MKILVAMSGGVDSTISAYLLKKQGHEVVGVHFNFVGSDDNVDDLEEVSKFLNIKTVYRDYRAEFSEKIIKYFVDEYENGRTPNPCALCNATMKFEKLLEVMKEENCDMIATGHYAKVTQIGDRFCIQKSSNAQKDQSYMLYRLSQEQLSHIIFPLGDMDKKDVRSIASEIGLSVANKKDSQDVCFINDIDYQEYIKRYEFGADYKEKIALGILKEDEMLSKPYLKKGEFVDLSGRVLGYHSGIVNYTIGQRKGLNIALGDRRFVVNIDVEKNQVVLGSNDDLMATDFKIKNVVYSGYNETVIGKSFYAKLRYRHDGTLCEIVSKDEDGKVLQCHLKDKVRAITKGQSAVFYDENDLVMFGGIID